MIVFAATPNIPIIAILQEIFKQCFSLLLRAFKAFIGTIYYQNGGISTVSDIPIEILQEIFKQCFSSPLKASEAQKFPWYLGHVCTQWRALFFSMRSTFWSRIVINYVPATGGKVDKRIKDVVPFFLDRTHGKPFSFKMCGYHPILLRLIDHSEQWEEVTIMLPSSKLAYLCGATGRLPQLKKLDISQEIVDVRNPIPMVTIDAFEDAPLLTHVVLRQPVVQFEFNWSSLTIVHLVKAKIRKDIRSILRETINLVELIVEWPWWEDLDSERGGLICLPHLERLDTNDEALLDIIEAPSLQRLKIDFSSSESDAGITTAAFLRRSGIKLRTLVIMRCFTEIAMDILSFTPKVEQLVLFKVRDMANLFTWLAGTGPQGLRCRNLNVVWARSLCREYGKAMGAMHDMIARRNPSGDVRDPSPREVIAQARSVALQSVLADLELLCRDRGIQFGFATSTWKLGWMHNIQMAMKDQKKSRKAAGRFIIAAPRSS